jgi:hypothetical protein
MHSDVQVMTGAMGDLPECAKEWDRVSPATVIGAAWHARDLQRAARAAGTQGYRAWVRILGTDIAPEYLVDLFRADDYSRTTEAQAVIDAVHSGAYAEWAKACGLTR